MEEHNNYFVKILLVIVISVLFLASILYLLPIVLKKESITADIKDNQATITQKQNNNKENNENILDENPDSVLEEINMENKENNTDDNSNNHLDINNDNTNFFEVKDENNTRRYYGTSEEECKTLTINCEDSEEYFNDAAGCGCELK